MDISVSNLIIEQLEEWLIEKLDTGVTDLKVKNIRAGRLQEDPTSLTGLNILISDEADTSKVLASASSNGELGMIAHTIGGGSFYFTNLKLSFIFHFQGEKIRSIARTKAYVILSRLKRALIDMPMPTHPETGSLQDDFGESALTLEVRDHDFKESGGPGSFIWKGFIQIRILTEQV